MMVEASGAARILVVEDDMIVGRDIEESLRGLGHEVAALVRTGEQAVRAASEYDLDLVLMDVRMPGAFDGVEAARRIAGVQDLPVVYLTAYSDDRTVSRAKETAPFGYLVKPFDRRELKTTVELAIYRHRMEQMLEASRARYRRLFEDDVVARCVSTPEGKILDVNRAFAELLGFDSVDGALDARVPDLYSRSSDREEILRELALGEEIRSHRVDLRRIDGARVPVLLHAHGVREDDGRLREVHASLVDMTRERRLEERLRRAARMEATGRMAGGIAHDFNNLLNAIRGPLELVLEDESLTEEGRADLRGALNACGRAARLVKGLFATGGKSGGSVASAVDLSDLVRMMSQVLNWLAGRHRKLEMRVGGGPFVVRGVAGQIEQVVLNLVLNARDATAPGGRVVMELEAVERSGTMEEAGGGPTPWVRLTVSDEGEGIDEELRERIFDPFYTTKEEGTGLGLAVVYGIVRGHHGEVVVESEPGRGTSFHVYLPRAKPR